MSTIEFIPRDIHFLLWSATDISTMSQMPQQTCKQMHLHTSVCRRVCAHESVYLFIIRHATHIRMQLNFE